MKIPGGKKKKLKVLWVTNSDPLDQEYYTKVKALSAEPGKIYNVTISHDDWCPLLKGGPCRCDPDVSQEEVPL